MVIFLPVSDYSVLFDGALNFCSVLLSLPIWFYTQLFILNLFLVMERYEPAVLAAYFFQIFGIGAVLTVSAVIREKSDGGVS